MQVRRRQTFACSRCYKKKRRCDSRLPACSSCLLAGAECVGIDRDSENDIPRSVVAFLEDAIAQLEVKEASRSKILPCSPTKSKTLPVPNGVTPSECIIQTSLTRITSEAKKILSEAKALVDHPILPYLRTLSREAPLPTPFFQPMPGCQGNQTLGHPEVMTSAFSVIPSAVAHRLCDVYIDKILPQHPFLEVGDLKNICDRVYNRHTSSVAPSTTDRFIILEVMAITTMTSKPTEFQKAVALATSLHSTALEIVEELSITSIRALQCLLLVAQLAHLLPHTGDLVHLVSEAARMATELGIHQDDAQPSSIPSASLDFRRRLFWVVYSMERSVNVAGHRCFAIRSENVQVPFPSRTSTNSIYTSNSSQQFINAVRYRQIQSEICGVQFCRKPFSNPSYDLWVIEMEQKALDWRKQALDHSDAMPGWFDFGSWYNLLMLHRPCLTNPSPSHKSIVSCFTATQSFVRGSWNAVESASLNFAWHGVHNCFEAGIVLLYSIKYYSELFQPDGEIGIAAALDVLGQVSNILCILSNRWHAAMRCGELFDGVRRETLRYFYNTRQYSGEATFPSSLNLLDDIVLHRPGDTQYLKSSYAPGSIQPSLSWKDTSDSAWWDLPVSGDDLTDMTIFDFCDVDAEFENLDWAYTAATSWFTTPFQDCEAPISPPLSDTLSPFQEIMPDLQKPDNEDFDSSAAAKYLNVALTRLPCLRCRKRRIKCDRLLPTCQRCLKVGEECTFYDAVMSQETPRPYVYALKRKFDDLVSRLETELPDSYGALDPVSSSTEFALAHHTNELEEAKPEAPSQHDSIVDSKPYFGKTSIFSRLSSTTVNLLSLGKVPEFRTESKIFNAMPNSYWSPGYSSSFLTSLPPRDVTQRLVLQYQYSFELLYPVFTNEDIQEAIEKAYEEHPSGSESHSEPSTMVYLILAVVARLSGRKDSRASQWSRQLFHRGLAGLYQQKEPATYEPGQALRLNVILCWYLWLDPSAGNIWRMLGHACRSGLELRRRLNWEKGNNWRDWVTHTTLFRMEVDVAVALGRPPQIIEADLPHQLEDESEGPSGLDQLLYELSRLKSRIQFGSLSSSMDTLVCQKRLLGCKEALDAWMSKWNVAVQKTKSGGMETGGRGQMIPALLTNYGTFFHSEVMLLYRQTEPRAITHKEAVDTAGQMIRCFSSLWLQQCMVNVAGATEPIPIIPPLPWSAVHSLCNAGTYLVEAIAGISVFEDRQSLIREVELCVSLLSSLESNADNAAAGLSAALSALLQSCNEHDL